MTMQEVMNIIYNKPKGYKVSFEWIDGGMLKSDYFPTGSESDPLIPTEHEAWELADRFARATVGETCNLYVVSSDHSPVSGYEKRKIKNR